MTCRSRRPVGLMRVCAHATPAAYRDGAGKDAERVGPETLCETGERRFHRNTSQEIDTLPRKTCRGAGSRHRAATAPRRSRLLGLHARVLSGVAQGVERVGVSSRHLPVEHRRSHQGAGLA